MEAFTLQKISVMIGAEISTIRKYIRKGELNACKVGRRYVVLDEDFKRFLLTKSLNNHRAKVQ